MLSVLHVLHALCVYCCVCVCQFPEAQGARNGLSNTTVVVFGLEVDIFSLKSVGCSHPRQLEMERGGSEGWGRDVKLDHFRVLQRKSLLAGAVCIGR